MPFDGIGLPDDKLYEEEDLDMPQTEPADILEKPPHFRDIFSKYGKVSEDGRAIEGGLSEEQIRKMRKAYYANVSLIDRKIGEVIEELKKSGEYENKMCIRDRSTIRLSRVSQYSTASTAAAVRTVPAQIILKNLRIEIFCIFISAHPPSTDSPCHRLF